MDFSRGAKIASAIFTSFGPRDFFNSGFFCQNSGAASKSNKRDKPKDKKVDDVEKSAAAKVRAPKPDLVVPEHAFSLRSLAVVLRVIFT